MLHGVPLFPLTASTRGVGHAPLSSGTLSSSPSPWYCVPGSWEVGCSGTSPCGASRTRSPAVGRRRGYSRPGPWRPSSVHTSSKHGGVALSAAWRLPWRGQHDQPPKWSLNEKQLGTNGHQTCLCLVLLVLFGVVWCCLVVWLFGWLVGCLVVWLFGCLVVRLLGC